MESKIFVCFLLSLVGQTLGYNLATNGTNTGVVILGPSTSQINSSLFGWSVHFDHNFKDTVFVGAPTWESEGAIFTCSMKSKDCTKLTTTGTESRDKEDGWLGASIAGYNGEIYTCAPFLDITNFYRPKKCCGTGSIFGKGNCNCDYSSCCKNGKLKSQVYGECYKYKQNKKQFERSTEFRYAEPFGAWSAQNNYQNTKDSTWYQRGAYGYSATVANGKLVVGAPITSTLLHAGRSSQDHWSGTIVEYSGVKNTNLPKSAKAPFAIQSYEMSGNNKMQNNYNLAGMALVKGYIFDNGNQDSIGKFAYIIGAPKADNNLGKVHVCIDCFTNTRGFTIKPDKENRQIGERFGESVTACDVNGDGKDDVIVGAPFYTDEKKSNQELFNTGRVHVFLMGGTKEKPEPTFVTAAHPPTLKLKLSRAARFGSATACLGDTDGDGFQEVVVGAPWYSSGRGQTTGAIFIYRGTLKGLQEEPSQKIYSSSLSSNGQKLSGLGGLGVSLFSRGSVDCPFKTNGRVPDCSQCPTDVCKDSTDCGLTTCPTCTGDKICVSKSKFGSQNGLTVGSHRSEKVIHMQFRKVTRIKDDSLISYPSDIDPENTKSIEVTVDPRIYQARSANIQAIQDLEATVSVIVDRSQDRITDNHKIKSTTIRVGSIQGESLTFNFIIDGEIDLKHGKSNVRDPISVDVSIDWKLSDCTDSQEHLCSVLDPKDINEDQSINKNYLNKKGPILIKTGCLDNNNCHCRITTSMIPKAPPPVVEGKNHKEHIGDLTLYNSGTEPAFSTRVTFSLTPNTVTVADVGEYCKEDQSSRGPRKKTFVCPYIEKVKGGSGPSGIGGGDDSSVRPIKETPSIQNLPITLKTDNIGPQINEIKMDVKVTSECSTADSNPSKVILAVNHNWKVTTRALYQTDGMDKFNWDWRNEQKTRKIVQNFEVANKGPSSSDKGDIFVYIPKSQKLLSNQAVSIETFSQTTKCEDVSGEIPSDIKAKSCSFSGDCVIKKCNIPSLKKEDTAKLLVSVTFSLENIKDMENKMFEVITSVVTNDFKNAKSFSEYKSTLEYREKSIFAELTNYWYVLVGAIIGVIFIIIICFGLYKCNVFSSIRIYKKEIEEANHGDEIEMRKEKVDSTEEATFENKVDDD